MAFGALKAVQNQKLAGKVFISGQDADLPNVQAVLRGDIEWNIDATFFQVAPGVLPEIG